MKIDVLTIFPRMFDSPFAESIIKRAMDCGALEFQAHDIREFALDKHKTTDDYPFGGGAGMVMKAEPLVTAAEAADSGHHKVLLTPSGRRADQALVKRLSKMDKLMLICGHYEGVDQRVNELVVDEEVSVGDFILSGGEIGAMALVDAVTRLLPGVLGNEDSAQEESFENNLLEYPHYTRPRVFRGLEVPQVLLSGDHGAIARWREERSLEKTAAVRPDMAGLCNVYTALVHYPVMDKKGSVVSTSITPVDLHDIARTSRTYGIKNYFLVSPNRKQNAFILEMLDFWHHGEGRQYNSNRSDALSVAKLAETVEEAVKIITEKEGSEPEIWVTSAQPHASAVSYETARARLRQEPEKPVLILFGTGWGLADTLMEKADLRLAPVNGGSDSFNHLSVRSAAAIMLDRLLGNGR